MVRTVRFCTHAGKLRHQRNHAILGGKNNKPLFELQKLPFQILIVKIKAINTSSTGVNLRNFDGKLNPCTLLALTICHPKWRSSKHYVELCVVTSLARVEYLAFTDLIWSALHRLTDPHCTDSSSKHCNNSKLLLKHFNDGWGIELF